MANIPVLDDCTKTADVIGYAATADEAAKVFMTVMRGRMDAADFAELAEPTFAFRNPTTLDAGLRDECSEGAFEPVW